MTSADSKAADVNAMKSPHPASRSRRCVRPFPARGLNSNRPLRLLPLRLLSLGVIALPLGCDSGTADPGPTRAVYFDMATKRVLVADVTSQYPAVHPETGQATLMPAMYCEVCQEWRQVPPPDQWNRGPMPLLCPKDKTPLVPTGPLPEEAVSDGN